MKYSSPSDVCNIADLNHELISNVAHYLPLPGVLGVALSAPSTSELWRISNNDGAHAQLSDASKAVFRIQNNGGGGEMGGDEQRDNQILLMLRRALLKDWMMMIFVLSSVYGCL